MPVGGATAGFLAYEDRLAMMPSLRFRMNDRQVVCETFDDEVLAINLETGTYCSMPGVSAQIWNWLIGGVNVGEITHALTERHDGERAVIENGLRQFVAKMMTEQLVIADETSGEGAVIPPPASAPKTPFVEPVVEVYTDMQDLLLLDPIHEVDERGWPVMKQDASPDPKN